MKAAKEKENRTRRGFLDDSSLSCLLSDDTVSVDRLVKISYLSSVLTH